MHTLAHALLLSILVLGASGCVAEARQRKPSIPKGYLALRHVNTGESVKRLKVVRPHHKHPTRDTLDAAGSRKLRHYLRDWKYNRRYPMNERLYWLLYRVGQHYGRPLEIVSGFRSKERKSSRHRQGRAVDFRVQGVEPKALWQYMKRFERIGLGYYPNAGFVHVDVRDRSFHWIDDSGPGEPSRYRDGVAQPKNDARPRRAKRSRRKGKRAKGAKKR